jgi:hypothetical protein
MTSNSASAFGSSHIEGKDEKPIYATSLFDSDVPIPTITSQDIATGSRSVISSRSAGGSGRVRGSRSAKTIDLTSADDFTLFPELPVEIRLKIWKLSLLGPRFIMIQRDGEEPHTPEMKDPTEELVWYAKASSPSPVLLLACRESRAETLTTYKPLVCSIKHDKAVKLRTRPGYRRKLEVMSDEARRAQQEELRKPVYCDFGRDVICIRPTGKHNFLGQIAEKDRNRMAYVAIPDFSLTFGDPAIDILQLPGLKELIIGREMNRLIMGPRLREKRTACDWAWETCEGILDEVDYIARFPILNRRVETIINGHRDKYPEGEGLVARPGFFVNHENKQLMMT